MAHKTFQSSSDIFGNAVYNTTPDEFVAMVKDCFGDEIEIGETWGNTSDGKEYTQYVYNNNGEREVVLIEYNAATLEDNLVADISNYG